MKRWKLFMLLLISILLFGGIFRTVRTEASEYGEDAYVYMNELQKSYPQRTVDSKPLEGARQWLIEKVKYMGYNPVLEPVIWTSNDKKTYTGTNIIFEKKGTSDRTIVVGAHYDSVKTNGADDNASGVGVLMETANRYTAKDQVPYTIQFILFDMEEPGCWGSLYHVSQLSDEEKGKIMCMINLDTLGGGDKMYLYGGGFDGTNISRTWLVEQALSTAIQMKLHMSYHPDVNEKYPVPVKYNASDQMAFDQARIPYLYLEASDWNGGNHDNFYQTHNPKVPNGKMMHVPEFDNLDFYNSMFPGRMYQHLGDYARLLDVLLTNMVEGSSQAVVTEAESSSMAIETNAPQWTEASNQAVQPLTDSDAPLLFYGRDIHKVIGGIVVFAGVCCICIFFYQKRSH